MTVARVNVDYQVKITYNDMYALSLLHFEF